MNNRLLASYFSNNQFSDYLLALFCLLFGLLLIKIFTTVSSKKIKQHLTTDAQLLLAPLVRGITVFSYLLLCYFCLQLIILPPNIAKLVHVTGVCGLGIFFIYLINNSLVTYLVNKCFSNAKGKQRGFFRPKLFITIIKTLVWIISVIFLADNLGIKITPIVASLGIGGIAIALAAQLLLRDFFSCLSLYFDQPFVVGDLIGLDNLTGTVERVGLRTTKLRSIDGEEIIVANSDIGNARVKNFQRRNKIRMVSKFKVSYQTSIEQLRLISAQLRDIVKNTENITYDYAGLANFTNEGFEYEVAFYIINNDGYQPLMIKEDVDFAIIDYLKMNNVALVGGK